MLEESAFGSPPDAANNTPFDELAGRCLRAAKGALSENTERALRSDLAIYAAWCGERGLSALPGNPTTIAAFVDDMAASRAPATVRRYVASISAAHRSIGGGKPSGSELVKQALRRMHRTKGRRQQQAVGLTWPLRERLLDAQGDRLIDARNRALLAVGYDTMLRRSELIELHVADLVVEVDDAATVLVRYGKADPEGRGATVYLAADSVALLREWLRRAGITDGRMFRSLCRGTVGERLHASQVPRIYKGMAKRAGMTADVIDGLSGHSTRVGPAQDMIAYGIGLPAILHAGRWKSATMVNRYGERLLARRSGAALLAELQRR